MPALVDFPQTMLPEYCYDFNDHGSESLVAPKTFSTWQDYEPASDPYHLAERLSSVYECPNEDYSPASARFMVGREINMPWAGANVSETLPSVFTSQRRDAYRQYTGSQRFSDREWHTSDYRSQPRDYPTPQSNLSLSPQQHTRGRFTSSGHGTTPQNDQYGPRSGSATSPQYFGDLSTSDVSYTQQCPYQNDGQGQEPIDESEDSDEDGSVNCEPYAQLIFRALKSAPGHGMVLKDIYRWFENNTDKTRKGSKGWQNSIRHNLSMNGGFKKVDQGPSTDEGKKGFIWVLEPSALAEGVKSTTRYRKPGSNKKIGKTRYPAPERQRSGAKGGKAAKKAAKLRRSTRFGGAEVRRPEDIPLPSVEVSGLDITGQPLTPSSMWTPDSLESFLGTASQPLTPITMEQPLYDYEEIDGVTSLAPGGPLFAEDCGPRDTNDSTTFHPFLTDEVGASSPRRTI
ncbi:MAG: hypothetical protein Q9170_001161 [Blastenia crenularia]